MPTTYRYPQGDINRPGRQFEASFCWVGLKQISLGFTVDLVSPNVEIHLPFCWLGIGWRKTWRKVGGVRLVWNWTRMR